MAKGSSKDADSSLSESVVAILVSFLFVADGCLVLIKRCSHGDDSNEFSHAMLRAVMESCSSVVRKASAPYPASLTTPTQPREGVGLNKLSEMLTRSCVDRYVRAWCVGVCSDIKWLNNYWAKITVTK